MNMPTAAIPTNGWSFAVSMPFEEGRFRVSVRDLPEVVTSGLTEAEALAQATDAIEVSLAYRLKHGEPLPHRTPVQDGEHVILISARLAAKASEAVNVSIFGLEVGWQWESAVGLGCILGWRRH